MSTKAALAETKPTDGSKAMEGYYPVANFKRRVATPGELQAASVKLSQCIQRLAGEKWRLRIDFGDKAPPIVVDCATRTIRNVALIDDRDSALDCTVSISPRDFLQASDGNIDPRSLIFYQRLKVTGSPRVAIKFFDKLSGRNVVSTYATTKPLPAPTTDYELAKAQIREFGYCFIKDALNPVQLRALTDRLTEQAAAEERAGHTRGKGAKGIQPVWNLVNKGKVFLDLLDHPIVDEFCLEFLGEYFLLSSYSSKIAHPGCDPQVVHTDQIGVQPALPHVNIGLNIFFFLDDFTDANGATRIIPGSHLPEHQVAPDNIFSTEGTIAAEAPAGTAFIFDTRLWHGTGANRTSADRRAVFLVMARSWMRTVENHTLSVRPEVLETMSERVKIMHGFRCTASAGAVDGPVEGEIVNRDFLSRLGEMH